MMVRIAEAHEIESAKEVARIAFDPVRRIYRPTREAIAQHAKRTNECVRLDLNCESSSTWDSFRQHIP